ncbi:MAG: hypothetical protein ABSC76_12865 [Terracidiphilus sp.]|jgi:hypothetical protein
MSSSLAISLFSAQPDLERRPYSFAFSMVAHTAVFGLVFFGIFSAPKIKTPAIAERYAVRHLDLHMLDPEIERAASSAIHSPSVHPKAPTLPPGGGPEEQQPLMRQVLDAPKVHQTLVQPDIPKPLKLPVNVPLPTVVIWNASKPQVKTIEAPAPQAPPVALAKPVIQRSNTALRLSDIAIRPSDMPMPAQPILPSTTSPVVIQGPKPTPPAPLTTAAGSGKPASGQIMSLSDTQMANGHVALPPVNQSASTNSAGSLAPGKAKEPSHAGHGNPAGAAGGPGANQGSGNAGNAQNGAEDGRGLGGLPKTTHITRQKEGQFGAVVVGSALQDRYPEITDVWSGRMAYTVYLPVGLSKSWILQYSLSKAESAATPGTIAHIDAPWPYSIVRPNIEPGSIDADALMVHGFVNQAGRFEALTIAFPPEFAQAQFVLGALAQWQFRPATQNGQNVKVEVLLIIPEESE